MDDSRATALLQALEQQRNEALTRSAQLYADLVAATGRIGQLEEEKKVLQSELDALKPKPEEVAQPVAS